MSISVSTSITQNRSHIYVLLGAITVLSLALLGSLSMEASTGVQAKSDLSARISIHEDEVGRGDTQKVMVTVSDKDDKDIKIDDADVELSVYPPESDTTTAEDNTNNDGEANFKIKIDNDAELGTYDIKIKVSKSGYNTETEESSFDVVGSGDKDDDNGSDDNDGGNDKNKAKDNDGNNNSDDNAGGNDDDNEDNDESDDGDQNISQGNACGNGLLSTNVLCQNVANQLQGDGNAINIIAIQTGGNEKTNMGMDEGGSDGGGYGGHVSSQSSLSSPSLPSSTSTFPSSSDTLGGQDQTTSKSNEESLASIVNEYRQARIDEAIELRMKYLTGW
jgi:hypothetical protein